MEPAKYIVEHGVRKINPAWRQAQKQVRNTPLYASSSSALAIISSQEDLKLAGAAPADSTIASLDMIENDDEYIARFKNAAVNAHDVLKGLTDAFAQYEVPLGMLNKLLALTEYGLHFIIDDSGSMTCASDAMGQSRWKEAEVRLKAMFDILAYVPCSPIRLSFLNRSTVIFLSHEGMTPDQFRAKAHAALTDAFARGPTGGTPTLDIMKRAFADAATRSEPTAFYVFTDGVPNGGDTSVRAICDLLVKRNEPSRSPVTFVSCTNVDDEAEWMKEIEESAPFVSELDDFASEKKEVAKDQGPLFPYTYGLYLISHLVAVISPDDLDALDERFPMTKPTLDNVLGYTLSSAEYAAYFAHHTHAWGKLYDKFLTMGRAADIPDIAATKKGLFARVTGLFR